MIAIIFMVLWIITIIGYIASSSVKHSTTSHFIWGVAFIIMAICFTVAYYYSVGTSDLPDWVKFLLLK